MDQPNILPIPARHVQKPGFARELSGARPAKTRVATSGLDTDELSRSESFALQKSTPLRWRRSSPPAADLTVHNTSESPVRHVLTSRQIIVLKDTFHPCHTLFSRLPQAPRAAPDKVQETRVLS
ncbi:hypothetical protein PQQ99_24585 [Paraburkholderia sediminicola]|uniref:hypothetical protein n=1 Tax=Paraburkholderia sediminicola TaxID=458836 RepID=UPI0038BC74F0